jgi:hypothetical protein
MRGMITRGTLEPLVDPTPEPSDELTQARAHHEAGHAIAVIYAGATIEIVTLRPPLCRTVPGDWPVSGTPRAAAMAAIELVGPMGEAKFLGEEIASEDDLRRHGGTSDCENFERRVAIICNANVKKIEALRIAAVSMADRLVSQHWDAICEVARDLIYAGSLLHHQVVRAIERAPAGHELLRAEPVTVRGHDQFGRLVEIERATGRTLRIVTRPARL